MGVFFFESLPQLVHTTTRPVGRWPIQSGTITRIGRATDDSEYAGQLVFLDEVPATMKVAEKIVPYRRQQGDKVTSKTAKWWRVEVQVPISARRVSTKLDVVVARGKLSGDGVAHSRLKGSYQKGKYRRLDNLAEPVKGVEELGRSRTRRSRTRQSSILDPKSSGDGPARIDRQLAERGL